VISGSIDLLIRENEAGEVVDAKVIDFKSIQAGADPEGNQQLDWTELALQVQLYALGARQVLGENTRTGAVHFLKDNRRVNVPVDEGAVSAAVQNVEWSVQRIVEGDFPMRPAEAKCAECDFKLLCSQHRQEFRTVVVPPPIHLPGHEAMARAFSDVDG
jgi:DNA helicase-2/ATP-dependent DNA helicase PcrA